LFQGRQDGQKISPGSRGAGAGGNWTKAEGDEPSMRTDCEGSGREGNRTNRRGHCRYRGDSREREGENYLSS